MAGVRWRGENDVRCTMSLSTPERATQVRLVLISPPWAFGRCEAWSDVLKYQAERSCQVLFRRAVTLGCVSFAFHSMLS